MPSHLSADRPADLPPGRRRVEALISQARRLRTDMDAVRRHARGEGSGPEERWQRALCELALHQLDDLDEHLAQLRDGPPPAPAEAAPAAPRTPPGPPSTTLLSRVGTAEWNLLTDAASWSGELYRILGRDPGSAPLTLDELPSLVFEEDRPRLTAMVTDCLVDAKPIDGEFRVVRPDGTLRTVHMMGEPVLDSDGTTASMWAVVRDVSELRRGRRAVSETGASLRRHRHVERTERRVAAEFQESLLPHRQGPRGLPRRGPGALDLAARRLPSAAEEPTGACWYDSLELPGGDTLLAAGHLTGWGVTAASDLPMLLGGLRGMAMAGTEPGRLMTLLRQLLAAAERPPSGSVLCCRYRPATRTLVWAPAGRPAPLLFRDGTGRVLTGPQGAPLGMSTDTDTVHGQAEEQLRPGDLILLPTEGLALDDGPDRADRLLALGPRLSAEPTAADCARVVTEAFTGSVRRADACVLVARVSC